MIPTSPSLLLQKRRLVDRSSLASTYDYGAAVPVAAPVSPQPKPKISGDIEAPLYPTITSPQEVSIQTVEATMVSTVVSAWEDEEQPSQSQNDNHDIEKQATHYEVAYASGRC